MKNLGYIVFLLLTPFLMNSQETVFFQLEVAVDKVLQPQEALFLRGDHMFMGLWEQNKVRLAKKNDTIYTGMFIMQEGEQVKFLIDQEEKTITDTQFVSFTSDTLIQISVQTKDLGQGALLKGQYHHLPGTVDGRLIDRKVTVRTPINYDSDTSKFYPSLYILDAQYTLGDDKKNLNHWLLAKTLDSLENAQAIEPFILVAVEHNFQNRSMEYADTDLGQRHRHYLCEELPRRVDVLFRTSRSPENRYLCGAVAAGFAVSHTALRCPEKFGNVIALSPAYIIHENNFINTINNDSIEVASTNFYIDAGEFEMDERLKPGIDTTVTVLRSLGCQVNEHFTPNSIPNGENFRYRIIDALMQFFPPTHP